jgi:hypothetical protein
MGRPLRKDVFGTDVINTYVSASGVRVSFYDGSTLRTDGIILKQRGAKTFVVARVGTPGTKFTCVLQSTTANAAGEMNLFGYIGGNGTATATNIAKITKRVATDFSGNRYKWYLENDSSNDYIVLTAI